MNKKLLVCAFLTLSFSLVAQQGDGGIPKSVKVTQSPNPIDKRVFAEPDIAALRTEDSLNDITKDSPWRFGYKNNTSLNMNNSGSWITLPNGDRIWRLFIRCQNALTVNLLLDQVSIPEGNELYVYNPDKSFILGKFSAYHLYEGTLGTELIPGNTAILEYYIPAKNTGQNASLNVNTVVHGYRTVEEFQEKAFGQSASCHKNVNCPDGSPWVNERNSTVMIVSGADGICTGALINNTLQDGKPYVLTANHCYMNTTGWIFRFNWQGTGCSNPGSAPTTFSSLSGAVLRSRRVPSDFLLVEITGGLVNGTVPASYNPYFAGWDRSGVNPTSSVSIHHPRGDIKKISFDDNTAIPTQATIGVVTSEPMGVWRVQWDRNTSTQTGSSGAPLFDQNHRIIGQLWGGGASCANTTAPDYYGRLSMSWNPAGSDNTNQLKAWLDSNNSGAVVVNGYGPDIPMLALDMAILDSEGAKGKICSETVTPRVTILNSGTTVLTSATIHYGFDGSTSLTYNWTGSLNSNLTQVVTLPSTIFPAGSYSFKAIVSNPNGAADQNNANDTTSSTFSVVPDGGQVDLQLTTDCFSDETSWILQNNAGTITFYEEGPYDGSAQTINIPFCLSAGCYKFTILDSADDGMTSNFCASGHYTIKENGNTLAQLTAANANFGSSRTDDFCVTAETNSLTEYASSWKLYPNPTSDYLTIESISSGAKTIQITNATGQVIQTLQSDLNVITLPAEKLAKGMYFIRLTSTEGTSQKSFVVK
ncbi:Protease 1 precursor [compost metagenome]